MFTKKILKNKIIIISLFFAVLLVLSPFIARAQFDIEKGIVGNLFSPECQLYGNCGFCDWIDLFVVLQKVILTLFGGLALVLLVWGAQGLITAAGNEENIRKNKTIITSTIIGVVIILAGYVIVNIVLAVLLTKPENAKTGTFTDQLFGNDWVTAFCPDRSSGDYCAKQKELIGVANYKDGIVPCITQKGGKGVCAGSVCKLNCAEAASNQPAVFEGCRTNSCSDATYSPQSDYYCPAELPLCCKKITP